MPSHEKQAENKTKTWTVMLFMVASKDEQTESAAIRNIKQLQEVGGRQGLNLLVQIDRRWPGYPERYHVRKDHVAEICPFSDRRRNDSGDPEVLREFVKFARTNYPADHYLLVLWGHAYGLGFGRDNGDALTLPEIAEALDRRQLDVPEGQTAVDILGVNACAMSYAEAAYELRDAAKFLLAPEITMPFAGWPYEAILAEIAKTPNITLPDLCDKIVEAFVSSFESALQRPNAALTAINLAAAEKLRMYLRDLTRAIVAVIGDTTVGEQIANAFLDTAQADVRPLIDLVDLCDRLSEIAHRDAADVTKAAVRLRDFLKTNNEPERLVLAHKAVGDVEGLNGLGIYAPAVTGVAELTRLELDRKGYNKLALTEHLIDPETHKGWADVVYKDLKRLLAPVNKVIAEYVNSTGATGVEDRTGVAQLLLSVYRSFVRLETAVSDAQQQLTASSTSSALKRATEGPGEYEAAGAVFGPPFLKLAPDRDLGLPAAVASLRPSAASIDHPAALDRPDVSGLQQSVVPLASLEEALANLEQTTRRVMTHARLGLGDDGDVQGKPGLGDVQGKPGLGDVQGKPGLGDMQGKPGLGDVQGKPGLGMLPGPFGAAGGGELSNGTGAVARMFGQVAWSLQLVENSVAKIENDIAAGFSNATLAGGGAEYQRRRMELLNQSFRGLQETIANAKNTIYATIAHPAYGVGPSVQGVSNTMTRQQVAIAGGLSSQNLQLL